MTFDLRWPIGLLFALFGAILFADGLLARRLVLGLNVNLWWGLVMAAFGAIMLWLAWRAQPAAAGGGPDRPSRRTH